LLRKLVALIDATFLYGGQAALGIAFGAALLLVTVHFTGLGSWQLGRGRGRYWLRDRADYSETHRATLIGANFPV